MTLSIQISPLAHYSRFLTTTLPSSSFRVASAPPPRRKEETFFEFREYCCYYYSMSGQGSERIPVERVTWIVFFLFFLFNPRGEGIDHDWGDRSNTVEEGGEGKAQQGRKVARFKGGEKKLTDATCFEGGAGGRRGDLIGDCPGALKVVGQVVRRWNNKFYAQLSLSFLFFETRTFQFRYFFLLSFFYSTGYANC